MSMPNIIVIGLGLQLKRYRKNNNGELFETQCIYMYSQGPYKYRCYTMSSLE